MNLPASPTRVRRSFAFLAAAATVAATATGAAPPPPPAPWGTPAPTARPVAASTPQAGGPLQSWKESTSKRAIGRFLQKIQASGPASTAPADARFAVLATDGVLWEAGVVPLEAAWALDRVRSLAPTKPEWASTPPFSTLLGGDPGALARLTDADLAQLTAAAVAGLDQDEVRREVLAWVRNAPPSGRALAGQARPAVRELLELLRTWGFRNYVVSDGPVEVTRALVEALYEIPPDRVIGPPSQLEVRPRSGRPTLVFPGEPAPDVSGASRLRSVAQQLGTRPLVVAGALETDGPLIEWASGGKAPFLALGFVDTASPSQSRRRPLSTEVLGGAWTVVVQSQHWQSPAGAPTGRGK